MGEEGGEEVQVDQTQVLTNKLNVSTRPKSIFDREMGRRRFIKGAAVALGGAAGAMVGISTVNEQNERKLNEQVSPPSVTKPEGVQSPNNPAPTTESESSKPAPEVEVLTPNPEFAEFGKVLRSYINTEERPEFWKRLEKVLSLDTQEIYNYMEVFSEKDNKGDAKRVSFNYFPSGFKEDKTPGVHVLLSKEDNSTDIQISFVIDEVGDIRDSEKQSLDKLGLEQLRVKKARMLLDNKVSETLEWDNTGTFDRRAVDPTTNISHRQTIQPTIGMANYLISVPKGNENTPEITIPTPRKNPRVKINA